nr:hypothetical protein BaRGS_004332 [Batillaria attramentaria]
MYDFEFNETDVETAVNELAAAANNGELYIIADEALYGFEEDSDDSDDDNDTSGRFSEFVTLLSNRVPSLHLWAAAVERVRGWMVELAAVVDQKQVVDPELAELGVVTAGGCN